MPRSIHRHLCGGACLAALLILPLGARAAAPRPPRKPLSPARPVALPRPPRISFVNDVLPVLTKAGCNAGACHGSQYGKGGFKLSLLAYDPEADHSSILRDARARRVRLVAPERSLVLRKPSSALPHGGGLRLPVASPGYRVLLSWLRAGAPGPAAKEPRLASITLTPAEAVLRLRGRQPLRVIARYTDGSARDVTHWARFVSNYDNIATVDNAGTVTVVGTGEAVVRAHFGTQVAVAPASSHFPLAQHGERGPGSEGLHHF
jgi:hypothetical protein